jgi:hypothetical protein
MMSFITGHMVYSYGAVQNHQTPKYFKDSNPERQNVLFFKFLKAPRISTNSSNLCTEIIFTLSSLEILNIFYRFLNIEPIILSLFEHMVSLIIMFSHVVCTDSIIKASKHIRTLLTNIQVTSFLFIILASLFFNITFSWLACLPPSE